MTTIRHVYWIRGGQEIHKWGWEKTRHSWAQTLMLKFNDAYWWTKIQQAREIVQYWQRCMIVCWLMVLIAGRSAPIVTVQHRLSHVFPSFSLCRSTSIVVPLSTSFHFLLYCSASFRHVPEPSIAYSCTLHRHVPSRDLPEGSFALSQLDGCCLYKGLAL